MPSPSYAGYLFAYFTGADTADSEQVYFARSRGNTIADWQQLGGGDPILRSTVGTGGVRDPFLLRAAGLPGEAAKFYLIGTDLHIHDYAADLLAGWAEVQRTGSRSLVVWESQDLVSWSEPRLVEVSPPGAGNTWAPEAMFDAASGTYLVYWASKLWGSAGEGDSAPDVTEPYNRMLCATTTDFVTFSDARVWHDPGHSVIDSTVALDDGMYYRFTKDERDPAPGISGAKFITLDRSAQVASTEYTMVAEGIGATIDGSTENGLARGEGPIVVRANDGTGWYLFIDEFGLRGYQLFFAPEIDSMDWKSIELTGLPPECRHGSILPVTAEELAQLDALL